MSVEATRRMFLGAVSVAAAVNLEGAEMEKVTGIGGFFFRAKDPKVLAKWYSDHLGVDLVPSKAGDQPWHQDAGTCAFQPFSEKTTYFDVNKQWMLNFRVRNMDAMVAQLLAAGIAVNVDRTAYPNGRFAHLSDPEGNPLELWEEKHDAH
jgi:predicted enzyme related to lactoylglutathione lyase